MPDDSPNVDLLSFGLERCGQFAVVSADPAFYRDEPVYAGYEPIDEIRNEIRAWAMGKPGYQDIWIDRENRGWLTIGFTSNAAARQVELEIEFPGIGVVAAEIEHGQAELNELFDEVFAVVTDLGVIPSGDSTVATGQVSMYVGLLDEPTLEALAQFSGRPVCFEGIEPTDAVIDGPQPTEGDGWRLLAVERTGNAYRTGVASNEDQYSALWAQSGVTAMRPDVDFETEIVIWFGAVYGSSCEIRMDEVILDTDRAIVHGKFVIPGNPRDCTADANPEAYLVAVERIQLPESAFAIQLDAEDPPPGVPEERTLISVDLSTPGSTATNAQVGTDPTLYEAAAEGYVVSAGGIAEVGFEANYRLDLSCNFELIGPINGIVWKADTDGLSSPQVPAWTEAGNDDGTLLVEILLDDQPPSLIFTANDHSETYHPAPRGLTSDCP